ncbi:malic enzyme-like NAD(P)-binding protein [Streptosporangium sp. NPDC087985]|uniref:malic enzyme-like NAD(P)-binding protein n=1 Tax=Streptosporangium sp. NPDC087985 TaxID=3366196 RepID=UPI00380A60FC
MVVGSVPPVNPVTYNGITYAIGQANNALLYPGLGLGAIVSRASRMSKGIFSAARRGRRRPGGRAHSGRVTAAAGGQPA